MREDRRTLSLNSLLVQHRVSANRAVDETVEVVKLR